MDVMDRPECLSFTLNDHFDKTEIAAFKVTMLKTRQLKTDEQYALLGLLIDNIFTCHEEELGFYITGLVNKLTKPPYNNNEKLKESLEIIMQGVKVVRDEQ